MTVGRAISEENLLCVLLKWWASWKINYAHISKLQTAWCSLGPSRGTSEVSAGQQLVFDAASPLNIQTEYSEYSGKDVRASCGSWWVLCTEAGSFLQSCACKCSFWPRFASVPALLTLNLAVCSLLSSLLSQLICVKCRTPGQNNQSDAKAVTQPCVLWKLQREEKEPIFGGERGRGKGELG